MNKAFTRESDFDPAAELSIRPLPVLPPGVKNYITPEGAETLREELHDLELRQRPAVLAELTRLAEAGLQGEKEHAILRSRRHQLEQQMALLRERVGSFEVVEPRTESDGVVRFGDRVRALDEDGTAHTYVIVGADEADPSSGRISWASPIGKAFLGAAEGDEVTVQRPRGTAVLEIDEVSPGS